MHSVGTGICDACQKRYLPEPSKVFSGARAVIKMNGRAIGTFDEFTIGTPIKTEVKRALAWVGPGVEDGYSMDKEERAIEKAKNNGMNIIKGTPTTLLLDLDQERYFHRFESMIDMVDNKFGVIKYETWPSKSGGYHKHALVHLKNELDVPTRVGLQSILGSDPRRETFNMYKYARNLTADPSLLFQPPCPKITVVNM